jgi:hypothetical protein
LFSVLSPTKELNSELPGILSSPSSEFFPDPSVLVFPSIVIVTSSHVPSFKLQDNIQDKVPLEQIPLRHSALQLVSLRQSESKKHLGEHDRVSGTQYSLYPHRVSLGTQKPDSN